MRFIHFNGFTRDWKSLGLNDEDLRTLELQIMVKPDAGAVIKGTGGLRKLRFSPPSTNKGKSGSYRVLYAKFDDHSVVVLAAAFAKSEQEDLDAASRSALKEILGEIEEELKAGG